MQRKFIIALLLLSMLTSFVTGTVCAEGTEINAQDYQNPPYKSYVLQQA